VSCLKFPETLVELLQVWKSVWELVSRG